MIVLAYLLALATPGPWHNPISSPGWHWVDLLGLVALVDGALMLAGIPLRAWNILMGYIGLSQL